MTAEVHSTGQQHEVRQVADLEALGALVADVTDEYIAHALDDSIDVNTAWEIYRTIHVRHDCGERCNQYCSTVLWVPLPPVSEVRAAVVEVADYLAEHPVQHGAR